ncbi:MAG: hypothetical protein AAFP78_10465 [Pseudomonadota bacterium]
MADIAVTGDVAPNGPRPRATLVMFSAGVDSAYTLVKLLRETDDEVFAHHVHFINEEGRHQIEAERARAIIRRCAETIRHVNYSETSINHRNMRWFGFDIMGVGFEAGICAHSFLRARRYPFSRWMIGTCLEEGHDEKRFQHVEAMVHGNCYPNPAPPFEMLPMVSKAEEIAYLGPEIAAMCWTCRRPVKTKTGFAECGTCETCKVMADARAAT